MIMIKKIIISIFLVLFIALVISLFKYYGFIKLKTYYAEDFGITELKSEIDYDNDGIDDYTDILNGAKEFVSFKPKYKSVYYDEGYPTDEYYVCTDVIWYALESAGYDLKSLVDEDIKNNTNDYNISKPDPNIDFRRVRNLRVFLDKYTLKLTTDSNSLESWQPGDIVVYKNHIAIVSNLRNKSGRAYIIHHGGQPVYEEDAVNLKEILGHYRWILNREN